MSNWWLIVGNSADSIARTVVDLSVTSTPMFKPQSVRKFKRLFRAKTSISALYFTPTLRNINNLRLNYDLSEAENCTKYSRD